MESKIQKFIKLHNLLEQDKPVLAGISGGADSVALALVLKQLGYTLTAVHCNFHLRGEESDRDEQFVRDFCQLQEIPLHVKDFQTEEYAKEKKISIEMAARELRYAYFHELMKSTKISVLAVAHHQNDQAETLLINLIRGTGIHGLRGMLPKNGETVRPLLCVTREEILDYLAEKGQEYVTDSTNLSTDYTRNKIRLELLPYLKTLNPSIISTLNHTALNLSEAENLYNRQVRAEIQNLILSDSYTLGETPLLLKRADSSMKSAEMKPVWHEILFPYGFTETQVENILSLNVTDCGKAFYANNWELMVDRDEVILRKRNDDDFEDILIYDTDVYATFLDVKVNIDILKRKYYPVIEKESRVALLDYDKLTFPLQIRKVQAGDKFVPLGMKGKKLISDFLTDQKAKSWEKKDQLVLCDAQGEILWVIGRRISGKYAISDKTQKIYRMELEE